MMKIQKNLGVFIIFIVLTVLMLFLPSRTKLTTSQNLTSVGNPAAVYCEMLGYRYRIDSSEMGQSGTCVLPDHEACNGWDFLAGKCGQEYSYCAQQGYDIKTVRDGKNPYSQEYGVCVTEDGREIGQVTELSKLSEKSVECEGGVAPSEKLFGDEVEQVDTVYEPKSDTALPTSFDWRSYNGGDWTSPVKNQGSCGSCWAFAAVGVTEAHHNILASSPSLDLDLAEQDLVSCSGAGTCSGGWTPNALKYIQNTGVVDEACMPYTASDTSCNKCTDWESRLTFVDLVDTFVPTQNSIKDAVVNYGPTYTSMGYGFDYGGYFDNDVYKCTDDSELSSNHAVVIVGYNDSDSYWIVKNSWGTGYRDNGYFKVGYGECNIDQYYAGYVREQTTPDPSNDDMADAYQVDSLPYTNSQSTIGADLEPNEPSYTCGYNNAASVWYRFDPASTGLYQVDTFGSDYDTVLHVFEDQGGSYLPISCHDDWDPAQENAIFEGEAGKSYLIGVTAYGGGSGGSLTLSLESYTCPADSLCTIATGHDGAMIPYPRN